MRHRKSEIIFTNTLNKGEKKWQEKFKYLDIELREKFLKRFSNKKLEILTEENGYGYTSNYLYLKLPGKFAENKIINI